MRDASRGILVVSLLAAVAFAQEDLERMEAADAITLELAEAMRDDVTPRVETFTRMKFRRPVPMRIQPRAEWEAWLKASGGGLSARHTLAYYRPDINQVTVVPWVIGGYMKRKPDLKTREQWVEELEPTMIHELVHGIHHQNFYTKGRAYAASMKKAGLTEEELDQSTVEFLIGEGVPELVALRTTAFPQRMHRHPRKPDGIIHYMRSYRPNGKDTYRSRLLAMGYVDGLNLMHAIALKAGTRGIRGIMYRPPPRVLLFQPDILGSVDLDDPPDPDSIFGQLAPEVLKGTEVRLAVNPGRGRYFSGAYRAGRAPGCLIGFVAEVDDGPNGHGRYAFFVADPDLPGGWSEAQAASLKALNPAGAKETLEPLPLMKGQKARLLAVELDDESRYVRAEANGLVVLAHETKPTQMLEKRALAALRALHIRRPKPKLYDEAVEQAMANLPK